MAERFLDVDVLLALTGDAAIRITRDFEVLDVTERALEIFGYTREEGIGSHLWSFVAQEEIETPQKEWLEFFTGATDSVPMESQSWEISTMAVLNCSCNVFKRFIMLA